MIYITRKEHFNAAHKLYNPDWSEEKNRDVFGVCSNENWHGHNYEIEVTVKGEINLESGMLINLKVLSKILKEEILDKVDHKNLNLDVSRLIHSLKLLLEYLQITEEEFNNYISKVVIPPHEPNYEAEFSEPTEDFNKWFRNKNVK